MKHYSTGKISQLKNPQVINYMELASYTAKYFFNNSICCVGCREFCIDQHLAIQLPLNTDWLTRRCQNQIRQHHYSNNNNNKNTSNHTHQRPKGINSSEKFYSYYHRHKRRYLHQHQHCHCTLALFVAEQHTHLPGYRQKTRKKNKINRRIFHQL